MTKQRRSFSTEFKHAAAGLLLDQAIAISKPAVCLELSSSRCVAGSIRSSKSTMASLRRAKRRATKRSPTPHQNRPYLVFHERPYSSIVRGDSAQLQEHYASPTTVKNTQSLNAAIKTANADIPISEANSKKDR